MIKPTPSCDHCGAVLGHSATACDETRTRAILTELLADHPERFGYDPDECPRGWRLQLVQHCLESRYGIVLRTTELRRALAGLGFDFTRRNWRRTRIPPQLT